jgi:Tol biopolymer transport system component
VQVSGSGGAGGSVAGAFTVSDTGLLAYQTDTDLRTQPTWFDQTGRQIASLGEPADYVDVVLSRDGARVATSILDPQRGTRDIWVFDVERGFRERFTSDPADDFAPVWSRGGDRIIFSSLRKGRVDLFLKKGAGGADERLEDSGLALGKYASSWSADEAWLLFIAGGRVIGRSDLMLLPADGKGKPTPFADSTFVETHGRFSPDGRWVTYSSNASGRMEVYARPAQGPGDERRISVDGGWWAQWRGDGKEIFFLAPDDTLMAASVTLQSGNVQVRGIRPLFKMQPRPMARLDAFPYDVTPDGQRFLVNMAIDSSLSSEVTLVVNWPALLKK